MRKLLDEILKGIRKEIKVAVVGMSGGADSTLVATLCSLALGPKNVIGVHMPYGDMDLTKFNANSVKVADKLGIVQQTIPIRSAVDALASAIPFEMSIVNLGNIRSRVRMTVLYSISHEIKDARVIGTGNTSEDFIGYDTKGGDALADFFPIGELFKSEVYALLDYLVKMGHLEQGMVDRTPSAGLWDGQTDEGEIGFSYNDMEPVIKWIKRNYQKLEKEQKVYGGIIVKSPITKFVWDRHWNNKHKHEASNVLKLRGR